MSTKKNRFTNSLLFLACLVASSQEANANWNALKSSIKQVHEALKMSYAQHPVLTGVALAGISCLGLYGAAYGLVRKRVPPMPQSVHQINCTTLIRNINHIDRITHIKNIGNWLAAKKNVTIYCTGFISAQESNTAARGAHVLIKNSLVPSYNPSSENSLHDEAVPCITFDFPDNPETFNFGQQRDQHYLDLVYREVVAKNPYIKITLVGICRGATTILNYLSNKSAEQVKNIRAIILDEPANPAIKEIVNPISYAIAKPFFPSYHAAHSTIFDAQSFPHSIPILVGSIEGDAITTRSKDLIAKLKRMGCSQLFFYNHTQKEKGHGFLIKDNAFAWIVNEFLRFYRLPHNPAVLDAVQNSNPLNHYRITNER